MLYVRCIIMCATPVWWQLVDSCLVAVVGGLHGVDFRPSTFAKGHAGLARLGSDANRR